LRSLAPEDEEIVQPAFETLPAADKKQWNEIIEAEVFSENSEHVWQRFSAALTSAELADVDSGEVVRMPPEVAPNRNGESK